MKHQHPDVKTHRRTASGTVHTSDTGVCVCVSLPLSILLLGFIYIPRDKGHF